MSRVARVVVPGIGHHMTQRGNRGGAVFYTPTDRQQYLVWLAKYSARYGLKVWAYCLMTNHVHLVVMPTTASALANCVRDLHRLHSARINAEYRSQGHVWQSRYFSCALDDAHLWEAVRYVELNPVRAGLVPEASAYPWSSAAAHCGLREDPVLSWDLPLCRAIEDWAEWLRASSDDAMVDTLRRRTMKGIPCGGKSFVNAISAGAGGPLHDRGRGRPRRENGTDTFLGV